LSDIVNIRLLTSDSVDRLRSEATGPHASVVWEDRLEVLTDKFGLSFVDSNYSIDRRRDLLLPNEGTPNRELDAKNSMRMLEALPDLTPADATDERLWATLALGAYRDYTVARWPQGSASLGNHIINHVFASTARGRERDHAIARLWWSGHYVRQHAPNAVEATLSTFFLNSQLSVDFLGRPNLATVGPFARVALKLFRKYYLDEKIEFNRGSFQAFFKSIDLVAGRTAVGALTDSRVEQLLEPRLREHLGLELSPASP
jgi:hypothetical protein